MRRVIFFPKEGDSRPEFRWHSVEDGKGFQRPKMEGLTDTTRIDSITITHHPETGRQLSRFIEIYHEGAPEDTTEEDAVTDVMEVEDYDSRRGHTIDRYYPQQKGQPSDRERINEKRKRPNNPAVDLATGGRALFRREGSWLCYCGRYDYKGDIVEVGDMTKEDYKTVVAWVTRHSSKGWGRTFTPSTVQAVKVLRVEEWEDKASAYVPVEIQATHPIFVGDEPGIVSDVSKRIGMPLLIQKYGYDTAYGGCFKNPEVNFMHLDDLTNSANVGEPAEGWQRDMVSNALIARVDRETLTPDTVQAFAAFCTHVELMFRQALDTDPPTFRLAKVERAFNECTSPKWRQFQRNWKQGSLPQTQLERDDTTYGNGEVELQDFDATERADMKGTLRPELKVQAKSGEEYVVFPQGEQYLPIKEIKWIMHKTREKWASWAAGDAADKVLHPNPGMVGCKLEMNQD